MPVLLAVAAAAAAVVFWMYRARAAGQVATELVDAAADVMNAARRFGFRRRADQHPVEGIDKPELAIGSLMNTLKDIATAGGGGLSERQKEALADIARHLRVR